MRRKSMTTSVLNVLLQPTMGGRRDPDKIFDGIVAKAERATGGDRAAVPGFLEGMRYLTRCFAASPRLSPMGWQSVQGDLRLRIENRLRVERLVAERPEIAAEPIERPVFIVGLPRTATTLAHNIIAKSPAHRGPALWEWMFTDIDRGEEARRRRIRQTERLVGTFMRLAPAFQVIHPLNAQKPDECNYLLPHGTQHLARVHMPKYHQWIERHDALPDYEYLKLALQVLQYGRERKRWILKSPMHLDHLPEIRKVFPDAQIVWTHRDPITVLGSLCSLVESSQVMHERNPDLHAIGATWLRIQATAIERARKARVDWPRAAFVDVPYPWLAAEPHQKVPLLYERLGAEWTDADARTLDSVLARPGIGRQHEYELARYGLDPQQVEEAFGDYPRMVEKLRME
ncbi:sulfotransferase family protein [Glycomyces niveus]|uniref:Sulfotransferase n=1 Tax=Glycomyces niveus TaxID=2820287 RepID=A0ABS3U2G3_9ACTN|nr:sulfotransferase [Glycomyces sp. NEAU-S30]MBO3732959.1 sulfotransferase [Glycomyces sp. NEAU-S30]